MAAMSQRSRLVYGLLAVAWATILAWQAAEHARVRNLAREGVINHVKDVSTTLGLVMRSQRRFGVISRERIESALNSLLRPRELIAIALLNNSGEVVASAGAPIDFGLKGLAPSGEHWEAATVTLVNLIDLGANVAPEPDDNRPTLVLSRTNMFNPFGTNRPPPGPPPGPEPGPEGGFRPDAFREPAPAPSPTDPASPRPPPPRPNAGAEITRPDTNAVTSAGGPGPNLSAAASGPASDTNGPPRRGWGRGRGGERRPPFGRPFWMSEEEYRTAVEKQGAHSFVVVLSTNPIAAATARDLWLRAVVSLFATVAAVGLGLAWWNLLRSSELEVRLVRASELNARLREMNLAAAGLAHETKNPLNIIRGLAQMISKRADTAPEVRTRSMEIVEEADRVTGQLNDFIHYSRPREVRRTPVQLRSVVTEVARALTYDLEEKEVQIRVAEDLPRIEADEPLLRQALFNLLLNAVQAVERGGQIEVAAIPDEGRTLALEVRDNGPGVPPEHRLDVFKPYFTTHQKGTGLGLAVVHQIVLAHGWDIVCLGNEPRGAVFRIAHLDRAPEAA